MANGDAAVAAGMDKVLGTADRRLGYDEINKTRDYIAPLLGTRQVDKGGTGATTAAGARTNLGVPDATAVPTLKFSSPQFDRIALEAGGVAFQHTLAYLTDIPGAPDLSSYATRSDLLYVQDGNFTSAIYNRALSGSYRVMYIGADGKAGWVSSSRRHKKNIKTADVDTDAILGLRLVTFLYKVSVDVDRLGELQHGLIAEEVDEAGLDWLVDYGADGQPEGLRYDRFGIALLPVVQQLARDLAAERAAREAVEARVAAIEAHLDALGGDLHA